MEKYIPHKHYPKESWNILLSDKEDSPLEQGLLYNDKGCNFLRAQNSSKSVCT